MKNNKSVSGLKSKKNKEDKNKDKNKLNKKFLILPKCTPNNKSYLKKNDKFVI